MCVRGCVSTHPRRRNSGRNQMDFYHLALKVSHALVFFQVSLGTPCSISIARLSLGRWGTAEPGGELILILPRPGRRTGKLRGYLDPGGLLSWACPTYWGRVGRSLCRELLSN